MYGGIICHAIVAAGGGGLRFGGDVPKQFARLGDMPIVMHGLLTLASSSHVNGVVLVVPAKYCSHCKDMLRSFGLADVKVVSGGANRQESVYNGLTALPGGDGDSDGIIIVHDGARPFVTAQNIADVIEVAQNYGAAAMAVPVTDTVKQINEAMLVEQTLCRDNICLVQTPQAFRREILLKAHEQARAEGITSTDDCHLVEKMGVAPKIILGCAKNIKITHSVDLAFAESLLKGGAL